MLLCWIIVFFYCSTIFPFLLCYHIFAICCSYNVFYYIVTFSVLVLCVISHLAIIFMLFVDAIMCFVLLLSHWYSVVVICISSHLAIISMLYFAPFMCLVSLLSHCFLWIFYFVSLLTWPSHLWYLLLSFCVFVQSIFFYRRAYIPFSLAIISFLFWATIVCAVSLILYFYALAFVTWHLIG